MKNKKYLGLLIIVTIFLFIPASDYNNEHAIEYNNVIPIIKAEFKNLLYQYDNFDDELPIEECLNRGEGGSERGYISKELALEDVEYIFSLLKYGYAGYQYFGGDESFLRAKKNIIWSVIELYGSQISIDEFLDIVYSELNFIQDSHLSIGSYKTCTYYRFFSSRKYSFYKGDRGYYTFIDKQVYHLINIDNKDPEPYMKLSLADNGSTMYNLGILSNSDKISISLSLLLESETETKIENVSLFEYIPHYKGKQKSYGYHEIGGIPILEVNSLCRMSEEDYSIEEFIADSFNLRGKENIIIDLRDNPGGSVINIDKWYRGFTGTRLQKDMVQSGLYTNTSLALTRNKFENKENEKDEVKDSCLQEISTYEYMDYFPGWSPVEFREFIAIKNDVNVYILIDKSTSSAAEFLAYYLRKLDNVLLVGTNTNGCTLTGNCSPAYLPNSKIRLDICHKLYTNKEFENTDGIGMIPDLWVKPDLALDRVIKYIFKNK
ncbi:MAG: S41 family peptidase [Tissierellaceae bacterium]